jgi:hypothetical protein
MTKEEEELYARYTRMIELKAKYQLLVLLRELFKNGSKQQVLASVNKYIAAAKEEMKILNAQNKPKPPQHDGSNQT